MGIEKESFIKDDIREEIKYEVGLDQHNTDEDSEFMTSASSESESIKEVEKGTVN